MSVSGLCQICGNEAAQVSCARCGNLVCEDHFDSEANACQECAGRLDEDPSGFEQD